jgi:predicted membrane channel-forming protein YqfA (hemolysin III family)
VVGNKVLIKNIKKGENMGMPSGISLFIISLFMIMPLVMLVNVAISEFKDNINKIVWIIIILVLYPIGWILYLIFGRKQRVKKGENSEK